MKYNFSIVKVLSILVLGLISYGGYSQGEVVFNVGCVDGEVGSSHCVDVTVENFTDITSYQFAINFNPNVIDVTSIDVSNSCLTSISENDFNDGNQDIGYITTLWFDDNAQPRSCDDGATIFTICFTFVGDAGECTPIFINSTGIDFVVDGVAGELPTIVNTCESCVTTNDLTIIDRYCEATPGLDDASLEFYPTGGVGPYDFTVVLDNATQIAAGTLADREKWSQDNLQEGRYTITITDSNGMMQTKDVIITNNLPIEYTLDVSNPTCWSRNNGRIEVVGGFPGGISIGQNPYTISWSNNQFNIGEIEDLAAGTYQVTVTGNTGCDVVQEVTLSVDTVKASFEIVENFYCEGADNARVWLRGEGGTPQNGNEYIYVINNGRIPYTGDFLLNTNLRQFGNELIVIDNAVPKCTSELITFDIPVDNDFQINIELEEDILCKGDGNGRIRISPEVGTETNFGFRHETLPDELDYPGGTSGPNVYFHNNVEPGDYRLVAISSNYGCSDTVLITIDEPVEELSLGQTVSQPTCIGSDGFIEINPQGGTPQYMYMWDGATDTDNRIDNLNGGDFGVTVTDMNGCQDSLDFTLVDGGQITIEADILTVISCPGDSDGAVEVTVSPPDNYTYEWTDANGTVLGNGESIAGLSSGWYFVNVSVTGCSGVDSIFLPEPSGVFIDAINITLPACADERGQLGVTAGGGMPGYDYVWSEAGSTEVLGIQSVLPNILPGTYTVRVIDSRGCEVDSTVTLANPPKIEVNVSNLVGVGCANEATGQAEALASGGSQGATMFTYLWSSGETGPNASMLEAGEGWVIASDNRCSSDTIKFTIPDAQPVGALVIFESVSCAESCDGLIELQPNGGTMSGYTINWPQLGQSTPTVNNLCPDTYTYIIEDSEGCSFEGQVTITAPDTLTLEIDTILTQNVSCRTNRGQIAVNAEGGNGGYIYTWTNNVSDNKLASEVLPGFYEIMVTDSEGCSAEVSYDLPGIEPVIATIPAPDEPICFGDQTCLTVTDAGGGVGGPYSFQVNAGPKLPLDSCLFVFAGTYSISVFDEAGCAYTEEITISQPNELEVEIGDDIEIKLGDTTTTIEAVYTDGFIIDSVAWSTVDPFTCVTDDECLEILLRAIQEQTISVFIQDEDGCIATDELLITINDQRDVYFPNIFSPFSSGGVNDRFQMAVGPGVQNVESFRVFDRWGNMMFSQFDYLPDPAFNDGWDGRFNGERCRPGVYVYHARVRFIDGRVLTYTGDITIVN